MQTFKQYMEAKHPRNILDAEEKSFAAQLKLGNITPEGMQTNRISGTDKAEFMANLRNWSVFQKLPKEKQQTILDTINDKPDVTSFADVCDMIYD